MRPTTTIELIGSCAARHLESGLEVDHGPRRNRRTTKSAIGPLCRKLIEAGHDPEGRVHIIRKALDREGYIPVFRQDRSLRAWAAIDCVENERRGPHAVKYCPYPDSVGGRNRQDAPEVIRDAPKTLMPLQEPVPQQSAVAA